MKCRSCNGTGVYIGFMSKEPCSDCGGKGMVRCGSSCAKCSNDCDDNIGNYKKSEDLFDDDWFTIMAKLQSNIFPEWMTLTQNKWGKS